MRQAKPKGNTLIMIEPKDESLFHAIRFCESVGLKRATGICTSTTPKLIPIYTPAESLRNYWKFFDTTIPFRTLIYIAPNNQMQNPTTCLPPGSLARAMHDSVEQLDQTVQLLLERPQKDGLKTIAVVAPHQGKHRREITDGFSGLLKEIRRAHGIMTYLASPIKCPPNPQCWMGKFLSGVW